jgi:hypothetical protein
VGSLESRLSCLERAGLGESLPEPHPLLDALYNASGEAVDELCRVHGDGMISFMAGEERVVRGDVERPGPEVTWNGGVCE